MLLDLPKCCGIDMRMKLEMGKFLEVECEKCKDVVYVKKESSLKPQLLDD